MANTEIEIDVLYSNDDCAFIIRCNYGVYVSPFVFSSWEDAHNGAIVYLSKYNQHNS